MDEPPQFSRTLVVAVLVAVLAAGYFGYQKLLKSRSAPESFGTANAEAYETDNPALMVTLDRGAPVLRLKAETSAQLARFTKAQVVMFATSWCPYCAQARDLFAANGVSYVEFDVERDLDEARFQNEVLRVSGVPVIVIGNRLLVGFDAKQISAGLKEL